MTRTQVPVPGEWRKAPGQIQFLQCRDSPESHIIKLGVVTLRQNRCTTPHKPIAQLRLRVRGDGEKEPPLFTPGCSGWCYTELSLTRRVRAGKDLRAPLVPHGALSASDCQSVSPCGAHAALLGSVPSLRRPPQLLLRHPAFCSASKAPRTFLFHCNPKGSTLMVHV
ncbi:hypothetical protein NQZ68_010268 [Dissostichus eleginoides]|nr:hypothetical protein NQZ68_010268 [Dissostichus eleginoides]